MEGVEVERSNNNNNNYSLQPLQIYNEDILFCIDIDPQSMLQMKTRTTTLTRLEAIKQAILLFVNSKLISNPNHRFAFITLSDSVSWLRKEFSSEVESTVAAMRGLSATTSTTTPDLTTLFQLAAHEAENSRMQGRILRVILFYCRSTECPHHQWPENPKLFTLDIIYLHDKPGPDNCPQEIYDTLVETLEHVTDHEGYIFESGQGLIRGFFTATC
ncbi:BRISC/BRCA1-A complex protein [Trifolium repens]|nr:BRISC/BRCA1-A complex protein [Trifolium repens]